MLEIILKCQEVFPRLQNVNLNGKRLEKRGIFISNFDRCAARRKKRKKFLYLKFHQKLRQGEENRLTVTPVIKKPCYLILPGA